MVDSRGRRRDRHDGRNDCGLRLAVSWDRAVCTRLAGALPRPTIFSITVFPAIVVAYVLLSRREEKKVLAEFGDEYRRYQEQVPMFFLRMGQWKALLERSSITEDQSKL
ncbi:MAG: hypothetical protein RIC89_01125 [Pseudomonadales bacterium]